MKIFILAIKSEPYDERVIEPCMCSLKIEMRDALLSANNYILRNKLYIPCEIILWLEWWLKESHMFKKHV